jgi:hypothetical protein
MIVQNWNFSEQPSQISTSICGSEGNFLGGFQKFGSNIEVSKMFTWINSHHYSLNIDFTFIKIDDWSPDDKVDVYLDNLWVESITLASFKVSNNYCGGSIQDAIQRFSVRHPYHSKDFVVVKFVSKLGKTSSEASWGIRDFNMNIDSCDKSCATCSGPTDSECLTCYQGAYISYLGHNQDNKICKCRQGYYFSSTESPSNKCLSEPCSTCLPCHYSCKSCDGNTQNDCTECTKLSKFDWVLKRCIFKGKPII